MIKNNEELNSYLTNQNLNEDLILVLKTISDSCFEISETIDWDNYFLDGLPELLQKSDKNNWEYDSSYYSYLELLDIDPYSNEAQILSISNHISSYETYWNYSKNYIYII